MDAETLDKQFQAMEGDTQVQAAANSTQQQKPKRKRASVADLKKQIDELEQDINITVFEAIGTLATRIEAIETNAISDRVHVNQDILERIGALEKGFLADSPPVWGEIDRRLVAMENATGALADAMRQISEGAALWGVRMEECEDMIAGMSKDRPITQEPTTKSEIEFASPPQTPVPIRAWIGDIEAVARVCLNMNDILMVCRALKAAGAMSDDNRIEILQVACRQAGETMTPGLQIRAGITYVEA